MTWYEERSAEDRAMDRDAPERPHADEPTSDERAALRLARAHGRRVPTKASACCPSCDLVFRETYAGVAREYVRDLMKED